MTTELPDPLVPAEVDLRDFAFMPLDVRRLRDSRMVAVNSSEECRAAILLWCYAWHQVPAASLPDDDLALSQMVGVSVSKWRRVRNGALYGFVKCSDGRLYHPVIAEKANRAWNLHHRLRHLTLRKSRPDRIKGRRWSVIRARILDRDGFTCKSCGSQSNLEIDHIKPLAEGGTHHDSNLQVLCMPCNRRKSYKWTA